MPSFRTLLALLALGLDRDALAHYQSLKGFLFVLVSGLALYCALAQHWRAQGKPKFEMDILKDPEAEGGSADDDGEADTLYDDAVTYVHKRPADRRPLPCRADPRSRRR